MKRYLGGQVNIQGNGVDSDHKEAEQDAQNSTALAIPAKSHQIAI